MNVRHIMNACAAAVAVLASSCGSEPAAPSSSTALRLTAAIGQPVVTRDTPATLTFQLENVGAQTVTLNFPTSCQINPYIVESGSGRIVYPAGGGWGCATVLTTMQVVPRGAAVESVLVRAAGSAPSSEVAVLLGAGQYSAYATLDANEIRLRADPITFIVQ